VSFLKSLFTQHLATKFMALLLSVVLFMFVQQQIEGKGTIGKIRLEFKLAADERGLYTIVTPTVELTDVGIQGMKKDVDALTERLEQDPTRIIEIDSRFLARYQGAFKQKIRLDEQFLKDHKVIPEEINVTKLDGDPLSIHKNEIITMKIELAPDSEKNTSLETDPAKRKHGYQGTLEGGNKVAISFNMPQGQVRAPRFVFPDGENRATRTLLVTIESVDDFLSDYRATSTREEVSMPVGFDWTASRIHQGRFTEYTEFKVGDRWLPFRNFKDQLQARYIVLQQSKFLQHNLPVRYLIRVPDRTLEYLKGFEFEGAEGGIDFDFDPQQTHVKAFWLQMPQGFDETLLDTLVLVLDIASAKLSGDKLDIPLSLDVMDRNREDILSKVRILLAEDKNYPYARYIKRK